MIVPSPNFGLPEVIVQAATEDIYAAVTRPAPFEARLDPTRCLIVIPLASSDMTISENGYGEIGRIRRAFSLTYLPSGTARRARQSEEIEHLYISITANRTATLLERCGSRKWSLPNRVIEHRHGDIASAAQMIRRHLFEPSCPNATFLAAATDLLLSHAIGSTVKPSTPDAAAIFNNESLRRVLEEIDHQMESGIRVSDIAEDFDLTPSAFSRKFRASVGCSPQRYVIERRIGRAREMLKETDLPIAQIAYALGFSSQAHLTSSFKDLLGVTPGRYRASFTKQKSTGAGASVQAH